MDKTLSFRRALGHDYEHLLIRDPLAQITPARTEWLK